LIPAESNYYYRNWHKRKMKYEPKSTHSWAVVILPEPVGLMSTLNGILFARNHQVTARKCQICCISTGQRWYSSSQTRMYEIEVLFWSHEDARTPTFAIRVHIPNQWTPCFFMAAIWDSVVVEHHITIFAMPNPLDRCAGTNITTINNISRFFHKKLNPLKFCLQFGLANVHGGDR